MTNDARSQEESTETIDMTNDVHSDKQPRIDDDFITSDEEQRYQRAASLDKLVDYCVEEFAGGNPQPTMSEAFLSNCVFMTYKWFLSSEELLKKFMQRYSDFSNSSNKQQRKFRTSLCYAVGFWITRYGNDFKKNEKLTSLLKEFHQSVEFEVEREAIDPSNIGVEEMRQHSFSGVTVGEQQPLGQRKGSMAFKDLSATTIAEQLTFLEYRMLRRIPFSEWKTYVLTGKLKDTTYLDRYVALFNGVSRWVQGMVLNCVSPQERAACFEKFQQTAKHLKELQNFNGLMAVAGGLRSTALSRLQKTQELLSQDCREFMKLLMEFLSSNGNYAFYRKALNDAAYNGFHIPILGIQLKDFIALHTVLRDKTDDGLLNVQKMIRLAHIMSPLLPGHSSQPSIQPNMDLIKMLRVSLQPRFTEEELYELSLAREPRSPSSSSPGSQTSEQNLMFADWAAELLHSAPDPDTTARHVSSMVDAVFKIYDVNKDGSISVEEFETIATNFPFIDSFGVIDVNSDGVISKEEMKSYFMKANCHELSKGFSHNFQETTYFTPTYCDHCGGLLWGIIKQGYRCKDCHINCHKHCKAEVVKNCQKPAPQSHEISPRKSVLLRSKLKSRMKLHKHHSDGSLKSIGREKRRSMDSLRSINGESVSKRYSDYSLRSFNGDCVSIPIDQYEQLLKAQQCNEEILLENARLRGELQVAQRNESSLREQLASLKQTTVTFIMDQMDALQMHKDTQV